MRMRLTAMALVGWLSAVPVAATDAPVGRVRKPVMFVELSRARAPVDSIAPGKQVPPRWRYVAAAQESLDSLPVDLGDAPTATMDPRFAALARVVAICTEGLAHHPDPEAAMWLHYLAGIAENEQGMKMHLSPHWRTALSLANGKMASELQLRLGQSLLEQKEVEALALWWAIEDPHLRTLAAMQEVAWFAEQTFGCAKAVDASVRLLRLPVQPDLPDAAILAETTLAACLADPLDPVPPSAVPASLPNRAPVLASAETMRPKQEWTASRAALELLRRCSALEDTPIATGITLRGTLAKLDVRGTGHRGLPAKLVRCVVDRARKVAIRGAVDAKTLLP